jgi:hypothetical protein
MLAYDAFKEQHQVGQFYSIPHSRAGMGVVFKALALASTRGTAVADVSEALEFEADGCFNVGQASGCSKIQCIGPPFSPRAPAACVH